MPFKLDECVHDVNCSGTWKTKVDENAVSTYLSIAAFDVTQRNYDRRDSRGSSLEDTIAGIFDVLVESMFIYGNR